MAKDGLTEEGGYHYVLIFMDLSMEPIDGFEATKEIRKLYNEHQQPWIVAVSGHAESSFIEKAWLHEIDEFVPKPMQLNKLKTILGDIFII